MTQPGTDLLPCDCCGKITAIDLLDGKPASLAGKPATKAEVAAAGDRGEDFDTLECGDCYGPAYNAGP